MEEGGEGSGSAREKDWHPSRGIRRGVRQLCSAGSQVSAAYTGGQACS